MTAGGEVGKEAVEDDVDALFTLAFRYLDGSVGPAEVAELNNLLLESQERRGGFLRSRRWRRYCRIIIG